MKKKTQPKTILKAMAAFVAVGGLTLSSVAYADHKRTHPANVTPTENKTSYYTYAKVLDAEPIIARGVETTAQKICRPVRERPVIEKERNTFIPSLIGSVVGGAIGHQFGGGSGKTVLTVLGSFVGANIAKNATRRRDHDQVYVVRERCHIVQREQEVERIEGYIVTYLYQGQEFTKTTAEEPGSQIRIRVQIEPVAESLAYSGYNTASESNNFRRGKMSQLLGSRETF